MAREHPVQNPGRTERLARAMKWQLDDLPIFLAVVEQQGITAAARLLGAPKSTVSASLSRLESGLGLRLIDRSTRAVRLTPEGEAFRRHAQLIVEQALEADALMGGLGSRPTGRLTVALPPAFAQDLVAPHLVQFHAEYPDVDLEIVVTTNGAALVRESADLAVVVGALEDSELVSRPLLQPDLIWVTSPQWLAANALGRTLDELRPQVQICETRYALRRLRLQIHDEETSIDLSRGVIKVNHPLVVRRVVMEGGGVSLLPRPYCTEAIAQGRLIQVLPHIRFAQVGSRLTVVYASRRLLSPRVRAFLEFLDRVV